MIEVVTSVETGIYPFSKSAARADDRQTVKKVKRNNVVRVFLLMGDLQMRERCKFNAF